MIQSQYVSITGGVVAGIAVIIALSSLVLLVPVILIVANRAEPDPRGLRPSSVYLFGMSFVMLQLTFAGSVVIISSLFSVIAPHYTPLTNSVARFGRHRSPVRCARRCHAALAPRQGHRGRSR